MIRVAAIQVGESVSLPVVENDGALTGWRTKPSELKGYYIEHGDTAVFVPFDVIEGPRRHLLRK